MIKLTGQKNRCECGLYFGSNHAFDKHRYGDFDIRIQRKCRTSDELAGLGWGKDSRGFWRTPARPKAEATQ